MEFILLRHGPTPGNLKHQYIGSTDEPLSDEGISLAVSKRACLPKIDKLWVSPLLRCRQTAKLFFDNEQIIVPGLRECDFGKFEGHTWEQLKENPEYTNWIAGGDDARCPGGESRRDFTKRCINAVMEILQSSVAENIERGAIVAHGGTIMAVMFALGLPKRDFYDWQVKNCCGYITNVKIDPPSLTVDSEIS